MATFPGDTFAPETCQASCGASEAADRGAAGINGGVMVVTPSLQRFAAFTEYAERRAAELLATTNTKVAMSIKLSLVGSAEQSFLREFYQNELNTHFAARHPNRIGWSWEYRLLPRFGQTTAHVMSRVYIFSRSRTRACVVAAKASRSHLACTQRYNARVMDCSRCPASLNASILHFACTLRPWDRPRVWWANQTRCVDHGGRRRGICAQCVSVWVERWFEAEAQMLQGLAAQGVLVKPISRRPRARQYRT